MPLTLYMSPASAAVRAVLMTAKSLGITLYLQEIDLFKGEQKREAFLKLNPTHTIPVLDDNGFILWESHAIMPYLCEKFGKTDALYPKDIKKRAIIHQRLHFNGGIFFPRITAALKPIIFHGKKYIDHDKLDAIDEAYGFLERFLESTEFMADNSITIADFCLLSTAGTANVILPIDAKKYPKVAAWLKRAETLAPIAEVYKEGITLLTDLIQTYLDK